MSEETKVVLLDRVVEDVLPSYCTHGSVPCIRCGAWCHLGHETGPLVESGEAQGLCMDCMYEMREDGSWAADAEPVAQLHDHERKDGPHPERDVPEDWIETLCANARCLSAVWSPLIRSDEVPVLRVCSSECARIVMADLER